MTDRNNWASLIHPAKLRTKDFQGQWNDFNGKPMFAEYLMLPMNENQMGNLLGALAEAEETGDWHGELISVIAVAMDKAGLKTLSDNRGNEWTQEEVARHRLKPIHPVIQHHQFLYGFCLEVVKGTPLRVRFTSQPEGSWACGFYMPDGRYLGHTVAGLGETKLAAWLECQKEAQETLDRLARTLGFSEEEQQELLKIAAAWEMPDAENWESSEEWE